MAEYHITISTPAAGDAPRIVRKREDAATLIFAHKVREMVRAEGCLDTQGGVFACRQGNRVALIGLDPGTLSAMVSFRGRTVRLERVA